MRIKIGKFSKPSPLLFEAIHVILNLIQDLDGEAILTMDGYCNWLLKPK